MKRREWQLSSVALALALSHAASCGSGGERAPDDATPGPTPIFRDDDISGPDLGAGPEAPGASGAACVGQTAGTEAVPAVLQFVVDISGSMDRDAPGTSVSKWNITRSALLRAIDALPASTSVGVVFYPDVPITAPTCFDAEADVPIAPLSAAGSRQRERIAAAFQRKAPDGGTPTHDAFRFAHGALAESDAPGARFSVLITDGAPTFSLGCEGTGRVSDPVDPTPLVGEAERARAGGISTFVIGSPGSEDARESLSRMAEAGGTGRPGCSHDGPSHCHFDMTESSDFARDLSEALGTIAGLALSCAYDIPAPPSGQLLDPARVNVLFTPSGGPPERIGKAESGPCRDGWQYSEDGAQVLLCGATCDRIRSASGSLSLEFGCATIVH